MEDLEEIKGFITYSKEEKKEQLIEETEGEQKEEQKTIQQLKQEVGERIVNAQGEDIMEKFQDKVLKDFMPCMLLGQSGNQEFLEYQDFDQCMDEFFS